MAKRFPNQFPIQIDSLLPTGEGYGKFEKRDVHVYGALPNETVLVRPIKRKKRALKAELLEVITPSPFRIQERDNHYLSSSPFQILPPEHQDKIKQDLLKKMFDESPELLNQLTYFSPEKKWHYRNKMEFSFTSTEKGEITFGFHKRFLPNRFVEVKSAAIASEEISLFGETLLRKLSQIKIPLDSLKTAIFRYSFSEKKCIGALYVKDPDFQVFDFKELAGWQIIYSDPQSPTSRTDAILFESGDDFLIETLGETKLKYYYDSFFQAHPEAFYHLLSYLEEFVSKEDQLLDLYSGVGTIGFFLANQVASVTSLEMNPKAVVAAKENLQLNNIENVTIIEAIEAEKEELEPLLRSHNLLIIDPPRAGIHPKVMKKILETLPPKFIYVSCNPKTQAQDHLVFKEYYDVVSWKAFDLYPQTPHLESVLIMKRKSNENSNP